MASRPGLLELRSNSNQSVSTASSKPFRSPRLHIAGEAPPELSPLDAFALQGRLLAKQLQETNEVGSRLSRLPPLTVESPLIQQGRSDYFRSMSQDSASEPEEYPEPESYKIGARNAVEEVSTPEERPKSMHPRLSRIPPTPDEGVDVPALPQHLRNRSQERLSAAANQVGYFLGARPDRSPSPLRRKPPRHAHSHSQASSTYDASSLSPSKNRADRGPLRGNETDSFDELGLPPPRASFQRNSSIASSPAPCDDELSSSMGSSFHSLPRRKFSSGSAAFATAMPSSAFSSSQRSPSVTSNRSSLPRPSFNFSRPLSRSGTPNLEPATRQASCDSQPSFLLADESAQTPVSMRSEPFPGQLPGDIEGAAPSYVYSKYSIPRGKAIQRSEPPDQSMHTHPQWDPFASTPGQGNAFDRNAPPSPPTRPSSSKVNHALENASTPGHHAGNSSGEFSRSSLDTPNLGRPPQQASLDRGRPSSLESTRPSDDSARGRASDVSGEVAAPRGRTAASVGTSDSASTIRPPLKPRPGAPSAADVSAEEHLAKGIDCHEHGSLNESTYHLRHAAKQNHPTAMLLYALACRHGWGMRANPREGVEWLRKAAEHVSTEIVDEDRVKEGKPSNFLENKTRRAQFALSIYELGVSHMNGWGIEQDKSLALRCFEIAGTWGDVDALAEAGFCYAQAIGCKKDLKRSAKFYRMAEAKGMSMVGNSWIHKSRYNDDGSEGSRKDKSKKKPPRSKSRTRTMFGLKSST